MQCPFSMSFSLSNKYFQFLCLFSQLDSASPQIPLFLSFLFLVSSLLFLFLPHSYFSFSSSFASSFLPLFLSSSFLATFLKIYSGICAQWASTPSLSYTSAQHISSCRWVIGGCASPVQLFTCWGTFWVFPSLDNYEKKVAINSCENFCPTGPDHWGNS